MRLWIVAVTILIASRVEAGPWCGGVDQWAVPAGTELPVHPTVAFVLEDNTRLDNHALLRRHQRKVVGTLDGKPVRLRTRDVRASHQTVRYVEVVSNKPGALKLGLAGDGPDNDVEYTIVSDWTQPDVAATTHRYDQMRVQMASRQRQGLAIEVNAPALLFHVRWRRDADDSWHKVDIAATPTAQIGETDCWADDVSLATLEAGIDLTATVELSNRKSVTLDLGHVTLPAK